MNKNSMVVKIDGKIIQLNPEYIKSTIIEKLSSDPRYSVKDKDIEVSKHGEWQQRESNAQKLLIDVPLKITLIANVAIRLLDKNIIGIHFFSKNN